MAQIVKLTASVPAGSNRTINHGLLRAPTIHLLGFDSDANITRGTAPTSTACIYTNAAGVPKVAISIAIAPHSVMNDRIAMLGGPTGSGGVQTLAHGLPATPDLLFMEAGTDVLISGNPVTLGPTNVTFGAGGNGSGLNFGFLVCALHSEWGTGYWVNLLTGNPKPGGGNYGAIGAGLTNVAVAHGLKRSDGTGIVPGMVLLGARCGVGITLGSTAPDATNIYLSSTAGVSRNFEALVIAAHSVIA